MEDVTHDYSCLEHLETFDPAVFKGDTKTPQSVCNFVLSLALIYNDCRDVLYARAILSQSKPRNPPNKSRAWGSYSGMELHIDRLLFGLLRELFRLICDNNTVLDDKLLDSVIRQLPSTARNYWRALIDVALNKTPSDDFGKSLLHIRNKISFHYDPKEVYKGYSEHFLGPRAKDTRAFISRGASMGASRFYFADAAVLGYLSTVIPEAKRQQLLQNLKETLDKLNVAVMEVVTGFIQKRGSAYRAYKEDAS